MYEKHGQLVYELQLRDTSRKPIRKKIKRPIFRACILQGLEVIVQAGQRFVFAAELNSEFRLFDAVIQFTGYRWHFDDDAAPRISCTEIKRKCSKSSAA
jgi:hypothetical protein